MPKHRGAAHCAVDTVSLPEKPPAPILKHHWTQRAIWLETVWHCIWTPKAPSLPENVLRASECLRIPKSLNSQKIWCYLYFYLRATVYSVISLLPSIADLMVIRHSHHRGVTEVASVIFDYIYNVSLSLFPLLSLISFLLSPLQPHLPLTFVRPACAVLSLKLCR